MKQFRIIVIGIIIWIIGVSIYTLSFYIPILEDPELQANIFLFLVAAVLDALITVPFLMAPYGGTHYSFFTAAGFWLIGIEFIAMSTICWYVKICSKKVNYL